MYLDQRRSPAFRLFLGCLGFFTVANCVVFGLASITWRSPQVFQIARGVMLYVTVGAQIGLHAIWCVLAPVHWSRRLSMGIAAALVLYLSGATASVVFPLGYVSFDEWNAILRGMCQLPLLLLAAQLPLWTMRIWCRWRIADREGGPSAAIEPLRIRDLMIATATIAMALTVAKISIPGNIVSLVVAALIIALLSTITTLPTVYATLRTRRLRTALVVIVSVGGVIDAAYIALAMIIRGPAALTGETIIGIASMVAGFLVCLTAPMFIARKLNYRLLLGRN